MNINLGDNSFYRKGFVFEINCIPFKTADLTSAKSVESTHYNSELKNIAFAFFKKLLDFFFRIGFTHKTLLFRSVNSVSRVNINKTYFKSIMQGSSYLKALSWLWGIGPLEVVSAQNMDYLSETEIEERIRKAISEGLKIAEEF